MTDALITLYKLISESPAIAEEVAIDLVIVTIHYATQRTIPLANCSVATQAAVDADGRGHLEIPLATVVMLQCLIGEYTSRTDLDQIATELAFKYAIFMTPVVDAVAQMKCIQILASGVLAVKAYATLTLNAAVHLMIYQWAEILITERSFSKAVTA